MLVWAVHHEHPGEMLGVGVRGRGRGRDRGSGGGPLPVSLLTLPLPLIPSHDYHLGITWLYYHH